MIDHKHYAYRVFWSDEDEAYIGLCTEFPRLSHIDTTPSKALNGIIDVVGHAVDMITQDGDDIPEPLNNRQYSGRFHVRLTPEIHKALVIEATEQGVSLNRYITTRLA